MSGREARLTRLEASVTVAPEVRGSYCRDCGGLEITDAILAHDARKKDSYNRMSAEDAGSVYAALNAGEESCRRCGARTLVGALRRDARE
jgi:hypothetical protein